MGFPWTTEQKQVIGLRHEDLLVSAAAGSGKTAVLVERILSLVTDREHPVDIDRLLVVTFTRAAAAEMKERIGRALEERLEQDPEDPHLQRQGVLLHHAQISTIDSFCTFVIQNYFHRIDLDPGYRIAEEDDLTLMRQQVLEDMLEEEHAAAGPGSAFLRFLEAYGGSRGDREIRELILKIHTYAVSDPDPGAWLDRCQQAYEPETEAELEETEWMRLLMEESGRILEGLQMSAEQLAAFVRDHPEAPQGYLGALESDAELLGRLPKTAGYTELQAALAGISFQTLGRKKSPDEDEELREQVKKQRNDIKKQVDTFRKETFGMPVEVLLEELRQIRPHAAELIRLVRRFGDAYTAAKRAQNVLDFSDLEHLALRILTEKTPEGRRRTEAARELAARFEEVMVDEYQDSNYLQEALLSAVSREEDGQHDRFMVGDVKQSIYGFRQARPEIFLERYHRAAALTAAGGGEASDPAAGYAGVRIDLHQNFRSRTQVLESINAVFRKLMVPEVGGIRYDDEAALHPGAAYAGPADPESVRTELLIVDRSDPVFDGVRSSAERIGAEARIVSARIRELVRSGQLWDAKAERWRPVEYRDCVILLRKGGEWSTVFARVLQEEGIPAYALSQESLFDRQEIAVVLNLLRLCDDPRQDIPLASVLRSPVVGLTDGELAQLRIGHPWGGLYEAACACAEDRTDPAGARVGSFLDMLRRMRGRVPRTPVRELIRQILEETGYGDYAAAMPAGAQRQADLELLTERAAAYEKAGNYGLFRFIRYVEQLQEASVDPGEAGLYGEEENIVRVMTIHKSKGLEFPVVFLAGLGGLFNRMDENSSVILHDRYGIGMGAFYPEQRRKHMKTLLRKAIQNAIRRDALAEEMRVLYVAMTRAKEKLVLVGSDRKPERTSLWKGGLTYQQLIGANSYLDWLLMAMDDDTPIRKTILRGEDILMTGLREETVRRAGIRALEDVLRTGEPGAFAPDVRAFLEKQGAFRYAGGAAEAFPAKMTVTELKHAAQRQTEEDGDGAELYPEPVAVPYVPAFIRKTEEHEKAEPDGPLAGAARGTAYHRVFAALDLGRDADVPAELDRMLRKGILSEEEYAAVDGRKIRAFLESGLGRRMAEAAGRGTLRREQPFVLDVPAAQLLGRGGEDDTVLIQGTIDAYWEEDGAYILVDYKTDRVYSRDGRELTERYRTQLACYAMALEQITRIPVREAWIWSAALDQAVACDTEAGGIRTGTVNNEGGTRA